MVSPIHSKMWILLHVHAMQCEIDITQIFNKYRKLLYILKFLQFYWCLTKGLIFFKYIQFIEQKG